MLRRQIRERGSARDRAVRQRATAQSVACGIRPVRPAQLAGDGWERGCPYENDPRPARQNGGDVDDLNEDVARWCGEIFAKRLALARRNRDSARDLLLEEIAARYRNIRSPRSRIKHAAQAWLDHQWGSL